jgi:hypothetical protein
LLGARKLEFGARTIQIKARKSEFGAETTLFRTGNGKKCTFLIPPNLGEL